MDEDVLLATTKYGDVRVPVYLLPRKDLDGSDAVTHWEHGKAFIIMAEEVYAKGEKEFNRILMHEFTHVIENLNDVGYLSSKVIDECTMLAQHIEEGMFQLWGKLKWHMAKPRKVSPGTRKSSRQSAKRKRGQRRSKALSSL